MATAGADGKVKVWDCRNWKGCVREWTPRSQGGRGGIGAMGTGIEVEWSQKGVLGVASGGSVYVSGLAFLSLVVPTTYVRCFVVS
jgi:U3 small nucleolar RNA-associated protein 7